MGLQEGRTDGDRPILIAGTRGTGKRSLARAIHSGSSRHRKMFRVFNCRSCSPLEARRVFLGELQGSRRGAGRYLRYLGLLEEVSEGTLYLEELESLPSDMQRILADVLSSEEFYPIGSELPLPFRGRLILSTCAPLAECITRGEIVPELAVLVEDESVEFVAPQGTPPTADRSVV
ncbi:MAG: sigma 54-interacting transcriptional regulator [Planctomycetota bacterium]